MPLQTLMKTDEAVLGFALAAMIATFKPSKRFTRKCRKRMRRAVRLLETGVEPIMQGAHSPAMPAKAIACIENGCAACGRCDGVKRHPPST